MSNYQYRIHWFEIAKRANLFVTLSDKSQAAQSEWEKYHHICFFSDFIMLSCL